MKKLWVLFLLMVGILCFNGISFASTEGEYDITDSYLTSGSAITVSPSAAGTMFDNDEGTGYQLTGDGVIFDLGDKYHLKRIHAKTSKVYGVTYIYAYIDGRWVYLNGISSFTTDETKNFNYDDVEKIKFEYNDVQSYFEVYELEIFVLPNNPEISLTAPVGTTTSKNGMVTVNVALNEANSIGATDMTVNYDSGKLSLVSAEGVNGQEVLYQTTTTTSGSAIRLVTVSDSKESFIKDSGNVVQLKFKAISEGNALIDVTAGKVANTSQEYTLPSSRLGQLSIFIAPSDVNNDGVTNLVDLALISYYRGYYANSVPSDYFPDKNGDGIIDQIDLQQILTQYLG